ncbi:tRNA lysidine(34) synthetase TilS [Marinimicrobium sp. ABcell2]|uniref:tRNA lysidine(34) synthetase TilS n=1 Tax=Marinimicrobium sp. ABcell2 TaxID=3069751 RepID=UPI0027B58806|nr:tRNA lysidine(34) synthetase TilS [Marinimicrobium sp. ABcell2]MDQ2075400.1 tRNA lysidine(34) synthetase TilS [Marinimicrobium sp. ABcell2]
MAFTPEQLRSQLASLAPSSRLWLAFSGGLDSTVLLHSLVSLDLPQPLTALHINHQLSPNACAWERHCEQECKRLGVPLHIEKVNVQSTGRGIEDAAREARYAVFSRYLGENDWLLTGHHADDQAETLLYRLMRGTGPRGLAAMARQRSLGAGTLWRPLLNVNRSELEDYARAQGLSWVEDESNADLNYDRNYLRHKVLPVLAQRWPGFAERWQQTAELCAHNETLLEELASLDLTAAQPRSEWAGWSLALGTVQELSLPRRLNVVRFWLQGLGLPALGRKPLRDIAEQLLQEGERPSAEFSWGQWTLRRFQQRLYLLNREDLPSPRIDLDAIPLSLPHEENCHLPLPGGGELRLDWQPAQAGSGLLKANLPALQVRWRQGGERCRPYYRGHSQTLKNLLQEVGLPPWWRAPLPLLYSGEQLVAVGDLWVCHGFTAPPGSPGFRIQWCRNKAGREEGRASFN